MRTSKSWICLLAASALCLSACGPKEEVHGPPPLDRNMLIGKWEPEEAEQFFQEVEFENDKSFRVSIWHVPEVVPATYSWSGNNMLTVQYHPSEAAKKSYKKSLADYRERIKKLAENNIPQYRDVIAKSANDYTDELPAEEELRIGLSTTERQGPNLTLKTKTGINYSFKKPK